MLGNFSYCNPTKLYFGKGSISNLEDELKAIEGTIALVYGGGSIKANGIYDSVIEILKKLDKNFVEISGVMPNPTLAKLYEGIDIARNNKVSFILSVGGGSVCDYAKALASSINTDEDPWDKYFVKGEQPNVQIVPVACILTMAGTGSEMNAGSVITNEKTKQKFGHVFAGKNAMPRFTILDPTYTLTLPRYQVLAGIYDIFSHILEQYFSNEDDNTSDYLSEGLMKSLIYSSRVVKDDLYNYEARSNIMWTATWALNTLIGMAKDGDWNVHALGQAIGGYTDATHGMTLSSVSMAYYHHIMPYGLNKFKRFAINVWGVSDKGSDEDIALKGLKKMKEWMEEIGLVMNIEELGVKKEDIETIASLVKDADGGYKALSFDEIVKIYQESLNS